MAATQEHMLAAWLYTFSEKILDTKAKNEAVRAMHKSVYKVRRDGTRYFPGVDAIQYIYSNTLPDCLMRKMIVDVFAYHGDPEVLPVSTGANSEFFCGVAKASMKIQSKAISGTIPEKDIEKYLENVE